MPAIPSYTPRNFETPETTPNLHVVETSQQYGELDTQPFLVKPEVTRDIFHLRSQGIDAQIVDVKPRFSLEQEVQQEIDEQVELLGALPNTSKVLFDDTVHSAGGVWTKLSKRAIALQTLTTAGEPMPHPIAPGIDPAIYHAPLFEGRSAVEILTTEKTPAKATQIYDSYVGITTTLLEDTPYEGDAEDSLYLKFLRDNGRSFVGSREFLMGVVDARAVQTRADAAIELAFEHVMRNPDTYANRPIVTASLACGAAGPVFELDKFFEANGVPVEKNILVDDDVMALASAVSLADNHGLSDKIEVQRRNLIKTKLTDFIEPHSVDIVDILGIVDYLKTNLRVGGINYKIAANFMASIHDIMRPGGIIVAGNALEHRPQQEFFKSVWPPLEQRDPIEMMQIIQSAGYDPQNVKVRVPGREGVYGVYGMVIPEDAATRKRKLSIGQRVAKKLVQFNY